MEYIVVAASEQFWSFVEFNQQNPIGAAAMVSQIAFIFIAMTAQVRVLRKAKKSNQLSLTREAVVLMPILLWGIHALVEVKNWCIFIPQVFGLIYVLAVLGHVLWYRKHPGGYKKKEIPIELVSLTPDVAS